VYQLYQVAKAFGQRPSAILGITDNEWLAWAVDRATWLWGHFVEGKMAETTKDGQPVWEIEALLGEWSKGPASGYAPASELVARFKATGGRR
jgi:hypothetical protein